jgi:hypothetical protein
MAISELVCAKATLKMAAITISKMDDFIEYGDLPFILIKDCIGVILKLKLKINIKPDNGCLNVRINLK